MFNFSNGVEAKNESKGSEVSLLLDPATILRAQSLTKRSHKAKKRVKEVDEFVEKEYDPEAVNLFSPAMETKKRRSQRTRKQIEDDRRSEVLKFKCIN